MSSYEERMSQKYNFFSSEDKNQVSDSDIEKETRNEEVTENVDDVNQTQEEENMLVPISAWNEHVFFFLSLIYIINIFINFFISCFLFDI